MLWWLTDVARRAGAAMIEGNCAANPIIVEALRGWDEAIPIVWEGCEGRVAQQASSRFWLVDALDGAARGESDSIVSITLVDGDRRLASVVFVPAADVVYFAGRNLGAWRQRGAQPATRLRDQHPQLANWRVGELVT